MSNSEVGGAGDGKTEVPLFTFDPAWPETPKTLAYADAADVSVSSDDLVFVITRFDTGVFACDSNGAFLYSWGVGEFVRTHAVTAAPDGSLWCVDQGAHTVTQREPTGRLMQTIGVAGDASNTGYDGLDTATVKRSAEPFNQPTKLVVDRDTGDLLVSDGYGNARVHRFDARGNLVHSWGSPGNGPGQFRLPHYAAFDHEQNLLVADRENDRVQVFSAEGTYLREWPHQRPGAIAVDGAGLVYVCALPRRPGQWSFPKERVHQEYLAPYISVMDAFGNVYGTIHANPEQPTWAFAAPHGMSFDSQGNLYVGEVGYSDAVGAGVPIPASKPLKKFTRSGARLVESADRLSLPDAQAENLIKEVE